MHNTEPPETQFFLQECNEREANFAFTRPVGSVGLSKLFTSLKASKPIRKRFITFGLDRMPQTYLAASLGKELILTEEESGRTEVRLITTDDGRPCEFIIQRFNTTKQCYEKTGLSFSGEDIDRLLVAILVHKHYRKSRHRGKEESEALNLDLILERLENVALKEALREYEGSKKSPTQ